MLTRASSGIVKVLIPIKITSVLCAQIRLNVIGTLGLLAWAKKKGIIKNFRSEAAKLQKAGFYATHALIDKLAKEIGEN